MRNVYEFQNGRFAIEPGKTRVQAAKTIYNEDYKTAMAHNQRAIEPGERGTLNNALLNFYGSYADVSFDDVNFGVYVKWSDLIFLEEPTNMSYREKIVEIYKRQFNDEPNANTLILGMNNLAVYYFTNHGKLTEQEQADAEFIRDQFRYLNKHGHLRD